MGDVNALELLVGFEDGLIAVLIDLNTFCDDEGGDEGVLLLVEATVPPWVACGTGLGVRLGSMLHLCCFGSR